MTESRSIGILAYDGVDARSLVGVHDALTTAAKNGCAIETTVFSLVPSEGVTADAGIVLVPDDVLIGTPDVVVVPGGRSTADGDPTPTYPTELPERLGQLADAGATVVGIGTGALALGAGGLLTERAATTAEPFREELATHAETVVEESVVPGDGVVTAAGPEAALAVARLLLEESCDGELAERFARGSTVD
ncbi:MAG: DJ-1/PfpI family protein [Halobacteriota archaeon]